MLPLTRCETFVEAHSHFFKAIADNPKTPHGDKPIDVDVVHGVVYVIYQDEHNTIQCQYEMADRHYTRTEIKRVLQRHQQAKARQIKIIVDTCTKMR